MIRRSAALTAFAKAAAVKTGCATAAIVLAAAAAFAQTRQWPSERPPGPLAAREIKFPPYELQTLPNGLQVVAVLHHEQPVVNMRLLIRAGAASDPKNKLGIAHMAASLLDQGTKAKSASELNDEIDFLGGAMGAGAGTDLTFVNIVVMKDSFEKGMRMLSDMARDPGFAQAEIERQRQQTLSGLRVSLEDPEYVANSVFDRLVYGFHPYGLPETGTPETVGSITRDDLVAYHQKFFAPNNAILAIVGDVTAEEAFNTAKKVFADWEKRDLSAQKYIDPPDPTRRVIVINKPDAVQTEVRVGHLGIPRKHRDYMAVNLAIRILGGEGSNRLHQVLRTQRGLTYGAQANMDTLKETGDFQAETNTRSEATGEVLRLIVDEFWRLQRERVSEYELADAKAYLTGSFPLTIETPESIAMQVVNVLFYGLPLEELQTFRERVNAVTVDDIQRVAREYLRPDRLSVVLVGNASAFGSQLKGVGFGTYETVELGDLDLTAANFKRGAARAAVGGPDAAGADQRVGPGGHRGPPLRYVDDNQQSTIAPQEGEKAKTLLDQAIAAKGGLEKLRGIKTIVAAQTMKNPDAEGRVTETTSYIQYPDRFRIETKVPDGMVVQAYDGTEAWTREPRSTRPRILPEQLARNARDSLRRDTLLLLLAAKDGKLTPRILPDVKDASGRVDHALEVSGPDLNPVVLYIDPATSLVRKQVFAGEGPGRPLIEEQFSDYRPVDGIQLAFTASRKVGPQTVERRASSIKINPPIDPTLFKRPAS
jgi:zinc protease